MLNAIDELSK